MNKRIAGMVLFTVLTGCFLLSAEPVIKLNSRIKATLFTVDFEDDGNNLGVRLPGDDLFDIEIAGENAGARLVINTTFGEAVPFSIYDYYGWLSFGDVFRVQFGEWDHRYADRVKNEESSWMLWEIFKLGAIDLQNPLKLKAEADNMTPWKATELAGDFTLGDVLIGISTGTNDTKQAYNVLHSFGARAGFKAGDAVKMNATYVQLGEQTASLGAYISPILPGGMTAVFGYSAFYDYEDFSKKSLHAIEARFRAPLFENALLLTTHNNCTFSNGEFALYNMVNISWNANESFIPVLWAANIYSSTQETDVLYIRPGITIVAMKKCTIDAGIQFTITMNKDTSATVMEVPVVFRVQL
ncbi:hypothetical protein K7I13_05205 [Brucepastera parasyntrophica]|uniref:hypothetical protein n=1 Tax=Brucepastera parasyntrophica TaxID=2880008 RepID=UPI002109CD44|nr:hypothetical protein [Brucepastera parasyntrophica]ULQ60672.1 hypothetical protein K7I13_05205 [Brucepastera parasyntrophica]